MKEWPWPCVAFSDLRILLSRLKKLLDVNEFVLEDSSYEDERCMQPPGAQHHLHCASPAIGAWRESLDEILRNALF